MKEQDLEKAFAPLKATEASSELRDRVVRLQRSTPRRSPSRQWMLVATACAAVLFAVVLLLPRKAQANNFWYRISQAINGVTSAEIEAEVLVGGHWVNAGSESYNNGNWRIKRQGHVEVYAKSKKWLWEPGSSIAFESERTPSDEPGIARSAFRLGEMYSQLNKKGFDFKLAYGKPETIQGQSLVRVTISRPYHETVRDIAWVNADTDLPVRGEAQIFDHGKWVARSRWSAKYNQPVDPKQFEADFGPSVKVVNREQFVQEWLKSIEKPLVTATIDHKPFALRDVFVNERGWVFLIWTGEIGGHRYRLFMKDDQGRDYTRAPFNPGLIPSDWSGKKLVYFGKEVVDGAWFVPLEPASLSGNRKFRLSVLKNEIKPTESHIGYGGTWFRRPFESDSGHAYDGKKLQTTLSPVGVVQTLSVGVSKALAPQYMPLFQDGVVAEPWANVRAIQARMYCWMFRLGDGLREDPVNRGLVAPSTQEGMPIGGNLQFGYIGRRLPAGSKRESLEKLESLHKQIIEADEKMQPDGQASGFTWYDLAITQRALGKEQEAQASLNRAKVIRPEIDWHF